MLMTESVTYTAAIMMGLLGSLHCVGMCGGIMGALAMAVPPEQRIHSRLIPLLLSYNLGRILSYGLAGALFGALAGVLAHYFSSMGMILRIIAALMLIGMGLYIGRWWMALQHLERAGSQLWNLLQPQLKSLMPVKTPFHALLIGALWGWIPCGLIYSALTWSATSADWRQAGITMLCFGLGTLPAVIATGLLLEQLKRIMQSRWTRSTAGLTLIIFGVWTLPISSSVLTDAHHTHGSMTAPHKPLPAGDQLPTASETAE